MTNFATPEQLGLVTPFASLKMLAGTTDLFTVAQVGEQAIVTGIDIVCSSISAGDAFGVIRQSVGNAVFAGAVGTSLNSYFGYRGMLPITNGDGLTFNPSGGRWDIDVWGFIIPNWAPAL